MNKIFTTSILSLAALFVNAQSLEIRDGSGTVINGQTVSFSGLSTDFEIVAEGYDVYNVSSSAKNIRCKRVEISGVTGTKNALCWSACSPDYDFGVQPILVAPSGAQNIAAGDFRDLFVLHYKPNSNVGMSSFRVVFYDQSNPTDSAYINVNFDAVLSVSDNFAKPASISAYPNPANNAVTIDVANYNEKATLRVIDALGVTVKTVAINGEGDVKLSVADLREGVYFYSLISGNNSTIVTRRLVINR